MAINPTKIILLLFLICAFIFLSGCSALVYERNFKTETDNNKWVKVTDTTYPKYPKENAQYKNNIIALTTKYSYEVGSCPISMGPPIFPIIPLFFTCFVFDSDIYLSFIIENSSDELTIDIEGIKLLKPVDQVVPIYHASYCPVGEGYNSRSCAYSKQGNKIISSSKIISTTPIILNKGTFILSLSYLKISNPDELTVEFGKIFAKGQQISVPSLKLRSSNGIAFIPLMLSGHEPVFRSN